MKSIDDLIDKLALWTGGDRSKVHDAIRKLNRSNHTPTSMEVAGYLYSTHFRPSMNRGKQCRAAVVRILDEGVPEDIVYFHAVEASDDTLSSVMADLMSSYPDHSYVVEQWDSLFPEKFDDFLFLAKYINSSTSIERREAGELL